MVSQVRQELVRAEVHRAAFPFRLQLNLRVLRCLVRSISGYAGHVGDLACSCLLRRTVTKYTYQARYITCTFVLLDIYAKRGMLHM